MNVLVTGASGFVGSHLTAMKKKGITFSRIDRFNGEDFMDEDTLLDYIGNADAVIHLAAVSNGPAADEDPVEAFRTNVAGTAMVAKMCDEFGIPLIFASSAGVYGDSIYGLTKKQGEEAAKCFMSDDLLIVRIFNVYDDSFDQKGVVGKFLTESHDEGTITIHGSGGQVRDFVHAKDLCRFFLHALKNWNPQAGITEFGTGKGTKIRDVAEFIAERTDSKIIQNPSLSAGIDISIGNRDELRRKFDFEFKKDFFTVLSGVLD